MFNSLIKIRNRIRNRYRINRSLYWGRRIVELRPKFPIISFSFDDFPQTALRIGGTILERYSVRGTYYVSLSLMDQEIPAGRAFSRADLARVIDEGHELGCHTFAHCHAWETKPNIFEASIIENNRVIEQMFPGTTMRTMSYPIACPRPKTKRLAAQHFLCCRGGGRALIGGPGDLDKARNPAFNIGPIDANNLQTYFLEKSDNNPLALKRLIDANNRVQGWLILATHDVDEKPTAFGCRSAFFEEVVKYAVTSGARILPIAQAWEVINASEEKSLAQLLSK